MNKPYHVLSDYFPHPSWKTQMGTAITALGGELALKSLTGQKILSAKPTNFRQLFDAYVEYIRNPGNRLRWDGSARGGSGYPMLDNDMTTGECAMFVTAFSILCWAPPPYGLGLNKTDFELSSYTGRDKKGFVSRHPTAGIVGLPPNVTGQELYLWDNHKVVKYQGRYWDVMYNTSYVSMSEMALYHLMPDEVELKTEDVDPGHRGTYGMADELGGGQGKWFKEVRAKVYEGPSNTMPF